MSITSSRPEDQPNQRRAARKVSRASSCAGHHVDLRTGLLADPGQDLLAVHGLPDGRGRERDDVLDALVLRDAQRLLDDPAQAALARLGQRTAVLQVSGEREFGLMRERPAWAAPRG